MATWRLWPTWLWHSLEKANAWTKKATAFQVLTRCSRAEIKPLTLEAKESISLINGTQAMLAVGTLALLAAENLVNTADVIGGLTLDALRGTDVAFDERIHKARPHRGQINTAANLRKMIEGSEIRRSHADCGRVQDAYSLRCIPQVHGAVRDTLEHCRKVLEIEINSAVDNPLVFVKNPGATDGEGDVLSGGNFHGEPLAFALDFLAIALSCPGRNFRTPHRAIGKSRR